MTELYKWEEEYFSVLDTDYLSKSAEGHTHKLMGARAPEQVPRQEVLFIWKFAVVAKG